jgi:hypothetical protein
LLRSTAGNCFGRFIGFLLSSKLALCDGLISEPTLQGAAPEDQPTTMANVVTMR